MEQEKDMILFIVVASTAVVLFLVIVVIDLFLLYRKRKRIAAQEIEIKNKEIDALIMKNEVESVNALLKGQHSERRRISQELHDRLGGILFTAKLYHGNIEKKLQAIEKEQNQNYAKLTGLLDEAVQEVRRISHDLYSGTLGQFGYEVALKQLISALVASNDIDIHMDIAPEMNSQKLEVQQELYAITQELLSNTLKHAQAHSIRIEIAIDKALSFHYQDDGNGFDTSASADGIGLKNIRNRVDKLGGNLEIKSQPGEGTNFYLTLPIEP